MTRNHKNTGMLIAALGMGLIYCGAAEAGPKPATRFVAPHPGNWSRRSSRSIRRVVIHTIEGSEGGAINWMKNPASKVTSHYIISHTGRITQLVADKDVAYHVRGNNGDTIGIENEGYAGRNGWTNAQMNANIALVKWLCEEYKIPKSRSHVLGHYQLDPSRRTDPGRFFDWDRLIRGLNGSSAPQPQPKPSATTGQAVEVTASVLNVRTDVFGAIIGKANRGQRFVVSGQRSGWFQISFGTRTAWISGDYARKVNGEAARVTASALNVRTGPSTRNTRIGTTSRGRTYMVLGRSGVWLRIQFDNRAAWVHGGYASTNRV